jgi:two-component system, LytTR family, sensor kinase
MIEVKAGELNLTIINKIVQKLKSTEASGIGIKNIIRRLDLLYENAYVLDAVSEGDIFKVNLKIKLEK